MELIKKVNKAKRVMLDYEDSEKVFLYEDVKEAVKEFREMEENKKGCGKRINGVSIYDDSKYHICGSHNLYKGNNHYILRHRFVVLCEDCKTYIKLEYGTI